MSTLTKDDNNSPDDNVEVALYETDRLQEIDGWDEMSQEEKLDAMDSLDPDDKYTHHNVTTEDYHTHLAELANPRQDVQPKEGTHIAFGNDGTTPSKTNSTLNNEVHRYETSDREVVGREYQTITLLSSDQAVGTNLLEAGLFSDNNSGLMFNHVLLANDSRLQPKTQDYAVTIRINLIYNDASEV